MTGIDIGWLAGIMDGEGTISLAKNSNVDGRARFRTPILSMTSTDREILERVQGLCGGCICEVKKTHKHPTWKPAWIWKISGANKVIEILRIIAPHMTCPAKVERARLLVDIYPEITLRGGNYTPEQKLIKSDFENTFLGTR